ncbi:hypothetical protein H7X46_18320 [Pseudonocardia sp. C8]|uniref:hypothetical protein n=1 Tax=Pseudonocardia sp. C8 TaxID=2762759 RepID=UPI001642B43D|nr:hypothetical protein [Pseudonocardia sp. C8]MBC3193018.1 hypothetical protein [Pseudonocardia sp. C8]
MRMRFGVDEDDAFRACADELVGGFALWVEEHDLVAEPSSADLLLQFKWLAIDGDLADWPLEQIETFLDGWCPRMMTEHGLQLRLVPLTVCLFLEYLHERALLTPQSARPAQIQRLCTAYADDYDELEARPLHPVLAEFETPPDPVRIPAAAQRASSAARARIVQDARALAEWCGEKGRALTRTGNLRLADARHLAEQLGTDDLASPRYARLGRADRLDNLTWVLEAAVHAGAVRRDGGRLVAGERFAALDDTTAHEDLVLGARDAGALTVSVHGRRASDDGLDDDLLETLLDTDGNHGDHSDLEDLEDLDNLDDLDDLHADGGVPPAEPADDATPAFLALLRHPDDGMAYDDLVVLLDLVLGWDGSRLATMQTRRLLERLDRLGIVDWTDTTTERDRDGEPVRTGGRVTLTAGGVACGLLVLAAEGLGFPSRPDPAVASVTEIVGLAGDVPPDEWRRDIDAWHAAQPDPDAAVAAFVARALAPEQPLVIVLTATSVAAERFGADVVDDLLRAHLDGPHRGQVARRLVARGLLDPTAVEPDLLMHASVDVLAVTVDTIESDEWPTLFAREFPPETVPVFDDLWRLDHPRLGEVLAELGGFHPDKAVAKAARTALVRWQSRTGGS